MTGGAGDKSRYYRCDIICGWPQFLYLSDGISSYNDMSILITYIGNYTSTPVNDLQINATILLFNRFVEFQQITSNFSTFSHRHLTVDSTADNSLLKAVQKLPNYVPGLDFSYVSIEELLILPCILAYPYFTRARWGATNFIKLMKTLSDRKKIVVSRIPGYGDCDTFVSLGNPIRDDWNSQSNISRKFVSQLSRQFKERTRKNQQIFRKFVTISW